MKRWFSALLTFIIAVTMMPGSLSPALAEAILEADSAYIEAEWDSPVIGVLSVELGEDIAGDGTALDVSADIQTPDTAVYASAARGIALVCEVADETSAFAEIARGGVMLVIGQATARWLRVAFNTSRGIVTGYVSASDLAVMSDDEVSRFMDGLMSSDAVALYADNLDMPLATLECAFILEGEHLPEPPEPEAAEAEQSESEGGAATEAVSESEAEAAPSAIPQPISGSRGALLGQPVQVKPDASGAASEIQLNTDALAIGVNETYTGLSAVFLSSGAAASVTWFSSNAACASVNALSGAVTGVSPGSAVITAEASNGVSASCTVTVLSALASMEMSSDTSWFIGLGETYDGLKVTMSASAGDPASANRFTWFSSNPEIISVNSTTGEITGVSVGSANITARAYNGRTITRRLTVRSAPSSITLNKSALSLTAGGMTSQLVVTMPGDTASARITYSSSNSKIAQVSDSGLVTAMSRGTATITASTYNGVEASCEVTVYAIPSAVVLDAASLALGIAQKSAVSATPLAADGSGTLTRLTYFIDEASPDPDCITLDSATGAITAVKKGQAIVNVRTHNGIQAKEPCVVTVVAAPASLYIGSGTWTIGAGETYDGLYTVLNSPAGEASAAGSITWTSRNPDIATVDASTGRITGVKAGAANITARSHNGKTATCVLTVREAPSSITLNRAELELVEEGASAQLTASLPAGAASAKITYTSSDAGIAAVSEKGLVSPVKPGTAVITVRTYNGQSASCTVVVHGAPRSAAFDTAALVLDVSEKATLTAAATTSTGERTTAGLTYYIDASSPNPDSIALNASTGEITALRPGRAIVNVRADNGVTAKDPCVIDVFIMPTGLELDNAFDTIAIGEVYAGLNYALTGREGFNASVSWTSSNPAVATVTADTSAAQGSVTITARSAGSTVITATSINGLTQSRTLTVANAPASLSISPESQRVYITEAAQFTVTFPAGTGSSYRFSVSDESIATITESGAVRGVKPGIVTVTATAFNDVSASATLTVTDAGTPNIPAAMPASLASTTNYYFSNMTNEQKLEYVIYCAQQMLGMPYIYGAGYNETNPRGFDCSGFVYWSFKKIGITLKASAYAQGYDTRYAQIAIGDLKRGDMVCFNTEADSDLSDHTGIYLGNGYFIHASSSKGVIVSQFVSSSTDYYQRNFSWGRRILG